ncbi:MAG: RNA polymerase sigma factor [Clostridia bacterium]|nr:RNA polymerase sigma factor [Clostridia bacterium]
MKDSQERINELAGKLKKGDQSAFEELYMLTSSKAYFIALKICGDKHDAEDIVQESYVTALARISTLEKTESFMSWFNRIVANKSKDFLRKNNPDLFTEEEERLLGNTLENGETFSPEANIDREELRTAVMSAVDELAVEKRACVLMKYFEDMSVIEIAESMEIPVSTVKNRLWSARKELKSMFERRGLTAAYSVAPFGVVTWALNSTFETVAQSFEGSATAAKIFSGIAVAGTAAATGAAVSATAGTAATGTGIFAKAAAASTMQKIVSGLVVAGVVTGSTVGITSVVKNNKNTEDIIPTTSYTETVDYKAVHEPEIPVVNEVAVDAENKESEKYSTKTLDFGDPKKMSEKVDYKGTLKLGDNHVEFEDGVSTYYVNFEVEEPGYYLFTSDRKDMYTFSWVFVPEDSQSGQIDGYYSAVISPYENEDILEYFEAGEHTLLISRTEGIDSTGVNVEYLGEEITDIQIEQEDLDNVILGYDEITKRDERDKNMFWVIAHDMTEGEEGLYGNSFRTKIIFSSGKVHDMGDVGLSYHVKGGKLKEGKNTVTFELGEKFGFHKEFVITAHSPKEYVKDIEVSNIDEFKKVKINEEGFIHSKPENYEVTVTYADGRKETFDGATWDRFIELDDGRKLLVVFNRAREDMSMDYRLRSRDYLRFRVSIGETDYIDEVCTVKEFDVIGYRKRLDQNNLEEVREYTVNIEDGIDLMKENAGSVEDFLWYSAELSKITGYNSYKIVKRIAGFELDYAITTYRILTKNEFDLFQKI